MAITLSVSWELLRQYCQCIDLLLVGLHVKADFVACVQVDIALHVIRSVGKVEHLLWEVTPMSNFVKGSYTPFNPKTILHSRPTIKRMHCGG